jgi:hypothetical protein
MMLFERMGGCGEYVELRGGSDRRRKKTAQ